jgi:hypothetical protein
MHHHVDAPRREPGFQITEQTPSRFLLSPQDCIHVAQSESTHNQVSLFP